MCRPSSFIALPLLAVWLLSAGLPEIEGQTEDPVTFDELKQIASRQLADDESSAVFRQLANVWKGDLDFRYSRGWPEEKISTRTNSVSFTHATASKGTITLFRFHQENGGYYTGGASFREELPPTSKLAQATSLDELNELLGPSDDALVFGEIRNSTSVWTQNWVLFAPSGESQFRYVSVFANFEKTSENETIVQAIEIVECVLRPAAGKPVDR